MIQEIHTKRLINTISVAFFIFLLTCLNFSQAQKIKAQLIAGANFSQINGDDESGFRKLGFNGGFGAYIPFNEKWSISFEGLYSTLGAKSRLRCSDSTCTDGFKFDLGMNYVQIPVLLNFTDKNTAMFGLGIAYERMLNYTYSENGVKYEDVPNFAFKSNKTDWLFMAEGSYRLAGNFWVNLRYSYSLQPFGSNLLSRYKNFGMFHNSVAVRFKYIMRSKGSARIRDTEDIE